MPACAQTAAQARRQIVRSIQHPQIVNLGAAAGSRGDSGKMPPRNHDHSNVIVVIKAGEIAIWLRQPLLRRT